MRSASVQTCITSPPYWGLRDYGTALWLGGDRACSHKPSVQPRSGRPLGKFHGGSDLLSKSAKYFCDMEAIQEPCQPDTRLRYERGRSATHKYADGGPGDQTIAASFEHIRHVGKTRNKRTVWTISSAPFKGAHFATFPPKLIEPCVLAGAAAGAVVLDPFSGAGTTGLVAARHGRRYVGIELKADYCAMSEARLSA